LIQEALEGKLKISKTPFQHHIACSSESHLNPISQVLMFKNQINSLIPNSLTPSYFFGHNLCLDIQTKNESPLSMFNLQNIFNN
jgi:hypothetical protein